MKRLIQFFSALVLALLPQMGVAAVGYDAQSSHAVSGATSIAFNHTNAGDLLLCGVSFFAAGGSLTAATYNTDPMTLVHEETRNGGNNAFRVYELIAPDAGTNQVEFTFSASLNPTAGCISLTGAHQTNPTGTPANLAGTTSLSGNITISTDDMGVGFAFDNPENDCPSYTSDQTIRFTVCLNDNSMIGSTTTSTGTVAMTFGNLTDQYSNISAGIGVPVEPAAAAGDARRVIVIQ